MNTNIQVHIIASPFSDDITQEEWLKKFADFMHSINADYIMKPAPKTYTKEDVSKEQPIEEGDVYTMEQFKEYCEDGSFIDYDGWGYLSNGKVEYDIQIVPTDIGFHTYDKCFSHVVWYNR